MYLSGSVGFTLLEKDNIYIFLLADIHDGVKYCKQNSIMISSYLDRLSNNNMIMLEEIVRDNFKLEDLWPASRHTKELKELNKNNEKIIPIDIRPMLIPFSWELVESNKKLGENILSEFLKLLDDFFLRKSILYNKYIRDNINTMKHQQLENKGKSNVTPEIHFNELFIIYEEFKNEYKLNMNNTINDIYHNNINILYRINNLCSMIMEWYIILLIHNNIKNCIIHIGLAHSTKILDMLTTVYHFKIIDTNGINKMNDIKNMSYNDTPNSCLLLPSDVTKRYKYNKKYGFYF